MNRRRQQIAAQLKRILADVFQRQLSDPRIRGMISITDIAVSKDLRTAVVKVSVFPDEHQSVTIHGLKSATLRIQKLVNRQLVMQRPPHLSFELDQSVKKEAEIIAAINEAIASDNEAAPQDQCRPDADVSTDEALKK